MTGYIAGCRSVNRVFSVRSHKGVIAVFVRAVRVAILAVDKHRGVLQGIACIGIGNFPAYLSAGGPLSTPPGRAVVAVLVVAVLVKLDCCIIIIAVRDIRHCPAPDMLGFSVSIKRKRPVASGKMSVIVVRLLLIGIDDQ